ncbi:unnamed protein product [Scytosiphon promiscuus]
MELIPREREIDGSTMDRELVSPWEIESTPAPDMIEDYVADLERKARRGTRHAAILLAVGLVLEVAATLWTLGQAMAIGVFHEPDCGALAAAGYLNEMLPRECERVRITNEKYVWDMAETITAAYNNVTPVSYAACSTLEDPPVNVETRFCDCWSLITMHAGDACRWTPAIASDEERGGLCLAKAIRPKNFDFKTSAFVLPGFDGQCIPMHPPGAWKVTVALLLVGLGVEFVETAVGYVLLNDPSAGSGLAAAGTAFEAFGIVSFYLWLLASEGCWFDRIVYGDVQSPARVLFLLNLVVAAVASTCLGVLADAVFHFSRKVSSRLPYLSAFGNALIWLGAALTEVNVTLYLAWRRQGKKFVDNSHYSRVPWNDFGGEIVALVVLEVLALMVVLTARVVFTRARMMLLRLKGKVTHELPSAEVRRGAASKSRARQRCGRLLTIVGGLSAILLFVFAAVGWPSFVKSYQEAKWKGLDIRVRFPRPVDDGETPPKVDVSALD